MIIITFYYALSPNSTSSIALRSLSALLSNFVIKKIGLACYVFNFLFVLGYK